MRVRLGSRLERPIICEWLHQGVRYRLSQVRRGRYQVQYFSPWTEGWVATNHPGNRILEKVARLGSALGELMEILDGGS